MKSTRFTAPVLPTLSWMSVGLIFLAHNVANVTAGEIRMRSGMTISGQLRKLPSLTIKGVLNDPNGPIRGYPVVMVESGAARYFVPSKQLAEDGFRKESELGSKQESFRLKHERTGGKNLMIASVGPLSDVEPFDKYGRRSVTLLTAKGKEQIVQGITEITPEFVTLTALNFQWEYVVATKTIPPETLETVLRHRVEPTDPKARLSLARFFIQAEMYPQAFIELSRIAEEFPDLKAQADSAQQGLVQEFGRVVMRELKARANAGQYFLATEYARQITPEQIGAAVYKDAQEFVKEFERQRETAFQALDRLDALAAELADEARQQKLQPLRSVLREEMHPETLGRLDPFLKSEASNDPPEEKLALAYSGWVAGAANAVTNLDQAIRMWEARFLIQEAVRATSTLERQTIYDQLRRVEGVGPEIVRKLIPQLPPAIETPAIFPGQVKRIEIPANDVSPATTYAVLLPLEYSPHHSYPLLIALRSQGKSLEQTVALWGGNAEQPGLTQTRGYIVISPEYAAADKGVYDYDSATHQHVLSALNDSRKRFTIDSDRVYLTGHGMGGDAAFDLGFTHPDEFAGIIPIDGVMDHYCKFYRENAQGTAWYIVNGELDGDKAMVNLPNFDGIYNGHGYKVDFLYCEFAQRGFESYAEEFARIFEWMSLHRRQPLPKEIEVRSLRKADQRFFWVEALDLPRNTVLPMPPGANQKISPMNIRAEFRTPTNLFVASPSARYKIWISHELVDFEKKVKLTINGKRSSQFIDPDFTATIDDYQNRGDRQRLYSAKLEF